MYCRNCGNEMNENAVVCVKCGVSVGQGTSFCSACGSPTDCCADFCTNCGVALKKTIHSEQKSKIAAGLLGIFVGALGIHNFYLGFTKKAIAQLLISVLSCGILSFASAIWGLVEGILILTDSIKTDANGTPLRD